MWDAELREAGPWDVGRLPGSFLGSSGRWRIPWYDSVPRGPGVASRWLTDAHRHPKTPLSQGR